jgi:thymidylate synthase (FAD)
MKVKLVSYSKPSTDFKAETGMDSLEDLIAYCARVSNPSNQLNSNTTKLIQYLVNNKHWSPLEMVSITLEIETTRDIARQILRHRSFSFQEFSQRYADPTKELNFEIREARLQDLKNRQNSIETNDAELMQLWKIHQEELIEQSKQSYAWAIKHGIAKEQARAVLPEGLTQSRMYMAGTLRSWVHYIHLRSANGTQKEHMEIARSCGDVISEVFPLMNDLLGVLLLDIPTVYPVK